MTLPMLATALLVVATLLLASWQVATESVWTDEVFTAKFTSGSWWQMLKQARYDFVQPPLSYALVKLSRYFIPDPVWALRLPSVLSAVAAILALCRLGRFDAALLLLTNSFYLHYAQEARPYSLFAALFTWLLWALFEESRRRWLFPLAAALVWTHYYGLLYLLFLLPFFPWARWRIAFGAATILPWLAAVAYGLDDSKILGHLGWLPTVDVEGFAAFWGRMVSGAAFPALGWAGLTLLLSLLALLLYRGESRLAALAAAALGPPLLLYLLSRPPLEINLFHRRYFTPTMVASALTLSLAAERFLGRRAALALCALLALSVSFPNAIQERQQPRRVNYRAFAQDLLARQASRGLPLYSLQDIGIIMPINFAAQQQLITAIPSLTQLRARRFWLVDFVGSWDDRHFAPHTALRLQGFSGRLIAGYPADRYWGGRGIEVTEWSE